MTLSLTAETKSIPMVSIIIPAKNEESNIARVLLALHAQDYPQDKFEIILVDNLSSDSTVEMAHQDQSVKVLESSGSISEVRNTGIKVAKGEVLAFIDADCLAPAQWLTESVNHLNEDDTIGIVSSVLRLENEQLAPWVERYWIAHHRHGFSPGLSKIHTISSYCFCARSNAIEESGAFNSELVTCEDADLGYRMTALGWNIVADKSIEVIHLGNAKNLFRFFLRQLWQGRSNIRSSIGRKIDPAEIGSLVAPAVFYLLIFSTFIFAALDSLELAVIACFLALSAPVLISFKKSPICNIKDLFAYTILWSTYLLARGLGIFVKIKRTKR